VRTRHRRAALVDSLGAQALLRVEEWAPSLAAEIQGIALGAGVPVEHVAGHQRPHGDPGRAAGAVPVGVLDGGERRAGRHAELGLVHRDVVQLPAVDDPAPGRAGG
jgi:hypothetical protein